MSRKNPLIPDDRDIMSIPFIFVPGERLTDPQPARPASNPTPRAGVTRLERIEIVPSGTPLGPWNPSR